MKKLITVSALAVLSLVSLTTQAGEFKEFREKVSAVRTSMIDLLMHKETRDSAHWKAADDKSAMARGALAALKAPAGKEATFKELKELATTFLNTRDQELRAALVKGDDAEAKRLLTVVQKERFIKITALTDTLDK